MAYSSLSAFVYDCNVCPTRCDGVSKGVYRFENDVLFSEQYEQMIIRRINRSGKYVASKSIEPGYPDITVKDLNGEVQKFIEVKVQQRTFMQVVKHLPAGNLSPSETVALNQSDLLRYFAIENENNIPTTIVWVLMNRMCVVPVHTQQLYYQQISALSKIYKQYGDARRFRRKSGEGDLVDGVHKGVTVNYHFSLKELKRWV